MKRIAGLMLGALLVVAACSSGGSKALTKDDFLSQGNAICKKGNDAIDSAGSTAFPDSSQQPTPDQIKAFFNSSVLPQVKSQVDGIAALKPPSDMKAAVDKLVSDARAKLTQLQDQVNKDPASLFSSSDDPFAQINQEANAIGLTVCGASSSNSSSST